MTFFQIQTTDENTLELVNADLIERMSPKFETGEDGDWLGTEIHFASGRTVICTNSQEQIVRDIAEARASDRA